VKELSHLPIIADPSHGTGKMKLVEPVSLGMVAAGADGLILEVHPAPALALCDGAQSLTFEAFSNVVEHTAAVAHAVGKRMAGEEAAVAV
jgi:3-deoxy-7-phosphoheptulonate synthase